MFDRCPELPYQSKDRWGLNWNTQRSLVFRPQLIGLKVLGACVSVFWWNTGVDVYTRIRSPVVACVLACSHSTLTLSHCNGYRGWGGEGCSCRVWRSSYICQSQNMTIKQKMVRFVFSDFEWGFNFRTKFGRKNRSTSPTVALVLLLFGNRTLWEPLCLAVSGHRRTANGFLIMPPWHPHPPPYADTSSIRCFLMLMLLCLPTSRWC